MLPMFAPPRCRHPDLPHYPQPDGTVKLAAGWLIERCGWKGKSLGPAGVYERQALVLVNRGGARGEDVLRLARAIQALVRATLGLSWSRSRSSLASETRRLVILWRANEGES